MSKPSGPLKSRATKAADDNLTGASDPVIFKALEESYAELNRAWAQAESELLKFSIPNSVCVFIGEDAEHNYLGFIRHGGKWRICHGYTALETDPIEQGTWTPIAECALSIRLECVKHFEDLQAKVRRAAIKAVKDVRSAVATLNLASL